MGFPADFPGSPTNRARLGRFPQEGPKLSWADFVVRWHFWGPHFGQSDILGAHLTWFDHIFFGELWHIPILFPSLAGWSLGHTAFSNDQVPGKHPLNQWAAGTSKSLKWCRPSDPRRWDSHSDTGNHLSASLILTSPKSVPPKSGCNLELGNSCIYHFGTASKKPDQPFLSASILNHQCHKPQMINTRIWTSYPNINQSEKYGKIIYHHNFMIIPFERSEESSIYDLDGPRYT